MSVSTSLVLAGITSLLSLLQVVSGGLQDKFGFSPVKAALAIGVPATLASLMLFGTTSGLNTLDIVDTFVNNIGVVGCAVLMTLFAAVVGPRLKGLRAHLNSVSSVKVPGWWDIIVGIIAPLVLGTMLLLAVIDYVANGYGGGDFPGWYVGLFGWGSIAFIAIGSAVFTFLPWKHRPISHHLSDSDTTQEDSE